ncbi:MAG: cytochrome c [Deltaproteobacteria bacterium]|jgi:mono/diheme cytochrome c family protein|nr:cytochrome c [Deltaproteobacteria bacterium]
MRVGKIILTAVLFAFFFSLYCNNVVFAMSGKEVFSSICINCHTINGVGGKTGPNLSNIGAKKSIVWLKDFIKNPDSYFNPGGTVLINGKKYIVMMPPFKNMLTKAKINSVAGYLESLK